MPTEQVTIATHDGNCPCHVVTPDGAGPWPGVIFYMDAGGIRPGIIDMARRLAAHGYAVLVPDLFYRHGPYGPFVPAEVFAGNWQAILGPLIFSTNTIKAAQDAEAWLAYLDTRAEFAAGAHNAVGFCMGGGMAIAAAGTYPDRFATVASFHGGYLAIDAPVSPHLLAPKVKAELYIAAAEGDASYPPEMAKRLEGVLTLAGVPYQAETYPAAHGWMMPDFPEYNEPAAERGWAAMLALFARHK